MSPPLLLSAETSALNASTLLPQSIWPQPPLPSHLRRQHRDVVELQAEPRSKAELLGLPFPGNKQQGRWVRAKHWALVSNSLRFAFYHAFDFGQFILFFWASVYPYRKWEQLSFPVKLMAGHWGYSALSFLTLTSLFSCPPILIWILHKPTPEPP